MKSMWADCVSPIRDVCELGIQVHKQGILYCFNVFVGHLQSFPKTIMVVCTKKAT